MRNNILFIILLFLLVITFLIITGYIPVGVCSGWTGKNCLTGFECKIPKVNYTDATGGCYFNVNNLLRKIFK